MCILGILQGNGSILEKAFFMVILVLISSQFQDQRNKKEEMVRVGRGVDVERCLRSGANTWVHTKMTMEEIDEASEKNISNPPLYRVF